MGAHAPVRKAVRTAKALAVPQQYMGNYLPHLNLLANFNRYAVDTIGLSVTDYADVDPMLRSIFFIDETTLRDAADAVALALASPMLNVTTMLGSAEKGVALYTDGTGQAILERAARYFRDTYEEVNITDIFNGIDADGYTAANPPVVPDQDGALRFSADDVLAVEGGYFSYEESDGAILGPELWVNPGGQSVDANNYSTYDAVTGVGRIVSDGTSINLNMPSIVGNFYRYSIFDVTGTGNIYLRSALSVQNAISAGTEYTGNFISSADFFYVYRSGPCDISFKFSVKQVTPVWIEKTPAPTKKLLSTRTGSKTVYADTDPTAWPRATVNPTRTNKCTCRKINPVDTTNLTKLGDAAAVLSVVDDTTALAAAGLDRICTSGKVYKLDNSAGSIGSQVIFLGITGNVNSHSGKIYYRLSAGIATIQMDATNGAIISPSLGYIIGKFENVIPANTVQKLMITVAAGAVVHFILPQLEEGAFCTDPIITAADPLASITRTGTSITKPTAGLFPMVSATEAQNFGIYMRVIPKDGSQDNHYMMQTSVDADNLTSVYTYLGRVYLIKRTAGVNAVNWVLNPPQTGIPIDILGLQTDVGMSIKVREYVGGSWGAWTVWENAPLAGNIAPAKIGASMRLGGTSAGSTYAANYPLFAILRLGNHATLAEYQAVAEAEVNKINA